MEEFTNEEKKGFFEEHADELWVAGYIVMSLALGVIATSWGARIYQKAVTKGIMDALK